MKISAAALPILILAAAHGTLAFESPNHELTLTETESEWGGSLVYNRGPYHPTDCCFSYTPRNIRCKNMQGYYETSSDCPLPAVMFITKSGGEVCTDPHRKIVKYCMKKLDSAKKWRKTFG